MNNSNKRTVKIHKRESTSCDTQEEVVLVRIKRSAAMRDDVEELILEFNQKGDVKRQKLVTSNEVLVRNFNKSVSLENTQFSLG
jgi:hypothetical protein